MRRDIDNSTEEGGEEGQTSVRWADRGAETARPSSIDYRVTVLCLGCRTSAVLEFEWGGQQTGHGRGESTAARLASPVHTGPGRDVLPPHYPASRLQLSRGRARAIESGRCELGTLCWQQPSQSWMKVVHKKKVSDLPSGAETGRSVDATSASGLLIEWSVTSEGAAIFSCVLEDSPLPVSSSPICPEPPSTMVE